jgi:hypothetical protein
VTSRLLRMTPILGAALLLLAIAHTAHAQASGLSAVSLVSTTRGDSGRVGNEIALPPLTASGSPRSYQVVTISLPDALARAPEVEVVIVPKGEFAVLGPRTRTIGTRSGQKRLGITIGIPANALAGRLVAAEAHFIVPGAPTMVVPIVIDVSLVRKMLLRPATGPINAQAGSDVILRFDIANSGNAVEKVNTQLALPTGWSTRDVHPAPCRSPRRR